MAWWHGTGCQTYDREATASTLTQALLRHNLALPSNSTICNRSKIGRQWKLPSITLGISSPLPQVPQLHIAQRWEGDSDRISLTLMHATQQHTPRTDSYLEQMVTGWQQRHYAVLHQTHSLHVVFFMKIKNPHSSGHGHVIVQLYGVFVDVNTCFKPMQI